MVCPPVREIINSLRLVDYFFVPANKPWNNYSRTSVARTLMARLPQLFRALSRVPRKNTLDADIIIFEIIYGDFLMLIMVCCVYSVKIASMRRF